MKICFLLRIWPIYGGGETVTQILANEFVSRGLDVHIVYFIDNGWDKVCKLDKRIHNFRIHNVNIGRFHYDPMNTDERQIFAYNLDNPAICHNLEIWGHLYF